MIVFTLLLSFTLVHSIPTTTIDKRLVTFNAGLMLKITGYADRKLALSSALKDVNADVLCLQELFHANDTTLLIDELQDIYPHSYSAVSSEDTTQPACSGTSFATFIGCLTTNCSHLTEEPEQLVCAVRQCGVMSLEQQCISCLALTPLPLLMNVCTPPSSYINVPGLLLLSKHPINGNQTRRFIPGVKQLLPRSYLQVGIDGLGKVICTHLSANIGTYSEPNLQANYSSWEEQNMDEAKALVDDISGYAIVVVMGDLNCGPVIPEGGPGEFSASYNHFATSMNSPYVDLVGTCTFCNDNYLVPSNVSYLLDHVFLKGLTAVSSKRILEGNIPGQAFPLSDHYGVEVVARIKPSSSAESFQHSNKSAPFLLFCMSFAAFFLLVSE